MRKLTFTKEPEQTHVVQMIGRQESHAGRAFGLRRRLVRTGWRYPIKSVIAVHPFESFHLELRFNTGETRLSKNEKTPGFAGVAVKKWQVQKDRRSNGWRRTIKDQRRRLENLLSKNPSLEAELLAFVENVYPSAIVNTANETGLDDENFPANCPYSVEQILDSDYLPE